MTKIISFPTYPLPLPTAAPQQSGNTITLQQALQDGANPAVLRAVADANERFASKVKRGNGAPRLYAQAAALRVVANELEATNGTQLHREAA